MPFTALDSIRQSGITVASDGAEYEKIAQFNPTDATTNPSLVYAAVSKPEYRHILDEAVIYAHLKRPSASIAVKTELALDRLLVQLGVEILGLIPGRVSVSVDPRLGYNYDAIVNKGRQLVSLFEELNIPRERVLVKIPATYPGILAANTLEHPSDLNLPINTNMTLIFGVVQALACAQAGLSVISPFIGRVKDWWSARAVENGQPMGLSTEPLSQHPGINLVKQIRAGYKAYGYKTQVMAAGFRTVDEIIELSKAGARGGADLVTLPPDLLDGLRSIEGIENVATDFFPEVETRPEPFYFSINGSAMTTDGEVNFSRDSKDEAISLDKVPEGLAKFSVDAELLENQIRLEIENTVQSLPANTWSSRSVGLTGEGRHQLVQVL